jgi:hypothetical protein
VVELTPVGSDDLGDGVVATRYVPKS